MGEEILTVIGTGKPETLFFTSKRVIIAKTGGMASRMAMQSAFGVLGALAEQRREAKKKEELSKLTPESILSADKKNFGIPYEEIVKVEFFKKLLSQKMRITTGTDKYEYYVAEPKKKQPEYLNTLRAVLGDKLVAP
jgi:hypothetical protein